MEKKTVVKTTNDIVLKGKHGKQGDLYKKLTKEETESMKEESRKRSEEHEVVQNNKQQEQEVGDQAEAPAADNPEQKK